MGSPGVPALRAAHLDTAHVQAPPGVHARSLVPAERLSNILLARDTLQGDVVLIPGLHRVHGLLRE